LSHLGPKSFASQNYRSYLVYTSNILLLQKCVSVTNADHSKK